MLENNRSQYLYIISIMQTNFYGISPSKSIIYEGLFIIYLLFKHFFLYEKLNEIL